MQVSIVYYLSYKLEEDIWKCTFTCSFMQKRFGKDKPETGQTGYLYRAGEKINKEGKGEIALTLRAIVMFYITPK